MPAVWYVDVLEQGYRFSSKPVRVHSMTKFILVGVQRQRQAACLGPAEITASVYLNSLHNLQLRCSATLTATTYLCQLIALEVLSRGTLKATRVLIPALCLASW